MNENELAVLQRKTINKLNIVSMLHMELAESVAMLIKGYNDVLAEKNKRISELESANATIKVTDVPVTSLPSDNPNKEVNGADRTK